MSVPNLHQKKIPRDGSRRKGAAWLRGAWPKVALGMVILSGLTACDQSGPTLVVVVGGLGSNQLRDLQFAVQSACPDATVVSAGEWDGYKADIDAIAAANPHGHLVLVGHSKGCEAISTAASRLPKVDLSVFIDPAWDDFALSKNIDQYLWYRRSDFGFERKATILGASEPKVVRGGHNGIPHSPELIAEVVGAIRNIKGTGNFQIGASLDRPGQAAHAGP